MARINGNRRNRGTVLVEAAIVIPMLLLLVMGVLEYGWMFTCAGEVANATRQGARVGADADSTNAQIQSEVTTMMSQAGLGSSGYTVTITPSDVTSLNPGDAVTVLVSVPYANITITGFPLLPLPTNLQSQVTMAREGS